MQSFEYAIKLRADPDGGFVVTCRDLPQLVTQGADREDALAQAVDAMDEVFAAYMLADLEFPLASDSRRGEYSVAPPAETVAKAALYTSMRKARVSKSQLRIKAATHCAGRRSSGRQARYRSAPGILITPHLYRLEAS